MPRLCLQLQNLICSFCLQEELGVCRKEHIVRSRVKKAGSVFIMAGGRTGRDGIHGVTFASLDLHEESEEESRGAVQLGDPILKEPLIHACLECVHLGLVEGMKDFGGGGMSSVTGEMAYAGGFGAEVYLDRVPLKEPDMAPWEIWISESQERMMLVVSPENVDRVMEIFRKWDVEATVVGKVIEEKGIFLKLENGKTVYLEPRGWEHFKSP